MANRVAPAFRFCLDNLTLIQATPIRYLFLPLVTHHRNTYTEQNPLRQTGLTVCRSGCILILLDLKGEYRKHEPHPILSRRVVTEDKQVHPGLGWALRFCARRGLG